MSEKSVINKENETIEALKNGDQKALEKLFFKFNKSLCFFVSKMNISPFEAEEIVQDTFIKLWNNRHKLININATVTFLYITSRNEAINRLQKQKRQDASHERFLNTHPDYETLPITQKIIYAETLSVLKSAIDTLPLQCRTVMRMLYEEGLSPQEISEQLGVTTSTIYNQRSRGIALLKRILTKEKLFIFLLFFDHRHFS